MPFEYTLSTKLVSMAARGAGFTGGLSVVAVCFVAIWGIVTLVSNNAEEKRQREH